ncbi:hypothetical protein ZWY2020_039477 [Hordeum vulgare]|nr:hypothetical protein ZWY2020_039477 [Hordeum vulgare]
MPPRRLYSRGRLGRAVHRLAHLVARRRCKDERDGDMLVLDVCMPVLLTKGGSLRNVPVGGGSLKNRWGKPVRSMAEADRRTRLLRTTGQQCSLTASTALSGQTCS